jgi:hypothetical protein
VIETVCAQDDPGRGRNPHRTLLPPHLSRPTSIRPMMMRVSTWTMMLLPIPIPSPFPPSTSPMTSHHYQPIPIPTPSPNFKIAKVRFCEDMAKRAQPWRAESIRPAGLISGSGHATTGVNPDGSTAESIRPRDSFRGRPTRPLFWTSMCFCFPFSAFRRDVPPSADQPRSTGGATASRLSGGGRKSVTVAPKIVVVAGKS